MLHMLQLLYTYVASVYPNVSSVFLYTYVVSVSDACLKCFICLLLYVVSVVSRCFKSRSGCCICCNDVSIVRCKGFIYFRRTLQRFHLDVTKVDQDVARRGRWLSLLLERSRGCCHVGFPCGARVPATDAGAGAGAGRGTRGAWRDVDTGAVQMSELHPDTTSRPNVQR
jgi:hypothetical protein